MNASVYERETATSLRKSIFFFIKSKHAFRYTYVTSVPRRAAVGSPLKRPFVFDKMSSTVGISRDFLFVRLRFQQTSGELLVRARIVSTAAPTRHYFLSGPSAVSRSRYRVPRPPRHCPVLRAAVRAESESICFARTVEKFEYKLGRTRVTGRH